VVQRENDMIFGRDAATNAAALKKPLGFRCPSQSDAIEAEERAEEIKPIQSTNLFSLSLVQMIRWNSTNETL
jgi:hypothetical protein